MHRCFCFTTSQPTGEEGILSIGSSAFSGLSKHLELSYFAIVVMHKASVDGHLKRNNGQES